MSRFGCSVCDAHPSKGDAILRISPLGTPFVGVCWEHCTPSQRRELEADIAAVRAVIPPPSSDTETEHGR